MIKVAIVGAGTMGRTHGNAYASVQGAKVTAVCDTDREKAAALAGKLGAQAYDDADKALAAGQVDMVDICLPTFMHKDCALRSIAKGKHVFCEKPIALLPADGREMVAAAEKAGVKFSVGQVVRYFPAYANARRIVGEKKLGTPKLIRTTRMGSYPAAGWDGWYSDDSRSGGIMMDLVIHDFDWIRSCFGEVERVYAMKVGQGKVGGIDHCLVTLRLENGAVAHVEGSWAFPKGTIFGMGFEIVGTGGQLEYDSRASSPIRKDIAREDYSGYSLETPVFPEKEPYVAELQDFVDSIASGRCPSVSGEDAVRAVEIAVAANESAKTGQGVELGRGRK